MTSGFRLTRRSGFRGHSPVVASCQPGIDGKVAAFRPSQLVQLGSERRQWRTHFGFAVACYNTHEALPVALRPRRNRPCRRTADKCDEFPPPHGAYPKAKDHELL